MLLFIGINEKIQRKARQFLRTFIGNEQKIERKGERVFLNFHSLHLCALGAFALNLSF